MKKFKVIYEGGQSRYSDKAVDFMIVRGEINGEAFELYSEADPVGHYEETGEWIFDDETGTHDELFAEIIRQAKKLGIDPDLLEE